MHSNPPSPKEDKMANNTRSKWTWPALGLTALAVVTFVGSFFYGPANSIDARMNITPTASPTSSASTPPPPADLTVTRADLAAATAPCASDKFNTNSMPSKDLAFGDAVSTGFTASLVTNHDFVGMINEFMFEGCGNPTLLDMAIRGLATLPVDQTHTVRDVNSWWMDKYFATTASGTPLRELFLTKKAGEGNKLFVTADFQEYASLTNLLLARVKPVAMDASRSLSNYYVPVRSGLAAGEIPVTELNPQPESRMAIWMGYTLKSGSCTNIEFGLNVLDKRFETRATCVVTPPIKTPPTTTPPTTNPPGGCVAGKVKNINGVCVTSKSTDPGQYIYTSGKPAAPNDGGTDTAPVVHTATPTPSASPSASPSPEPVKQTDAPTPSNAPSTCPIPPGMTSC